VEQVQDVPTNYQKHAGAQRNSQQILKSKWDVNKIDDVNSF